MNFNVETVYLILRLFRKENLGKKLMSEISKRKLHLYHALRIFIAAVCVVIFSVIITMGFGGQNSADMNKYINIRMVGTAFMNGKVAALLEDSQNNIEGFFEEEQEVAGYKIDEISSDGIIISADGKEYFIRIFSTEQIPVRSALKNAATSDEDGEDAKMFEEKSDIVSELNYQIAKTKKETKTVKYIPQRTKSSGFAVPLKGRLSSRFGWRQHPLGGGDKEFHKGWDIVAKYGSPVRSAEDGIVSIARYYGDLGNSVIITHKNGYITRYGHLSKILVKKGQVITKGDVVGLVGSTGMSTGPHLHFDIRRGQKVIDPEVFLSPSSLR